MTDWEELKDITPDVQVSATESTVDNVESTVDNVESTADNVKSASPEPAQDHPGIALLDIAIDESVRYCQSEKLPPPNLGIWENFSRGMLNRALWHYFPEGDAPDSPALCLIIGVGGLSVCYIPVIMAIYQNEKEKQETTEKKGRTVRDPHTGEETVIRKPPEAPPRQEPEPDPPLTEVQKRIQDIQVDEIIGVNG